MAGPCRIRPSTWADLESICRIERASFADPWSRTSLASWLGADLLVAEDGPGRVTGFAIGRVVLGEAEVINLAVDPGFRRAGIGRRLLAAQLTDFRHRGVRRVFLEVRESNVSAIALYRQHGFRIVGVRPGYYARPKENALQLRLDP